MMRLFLIFAFLLSNNYLFGQENIIECNKKILGQWELQSISKPFRQKPEINLLKIWDFKNGYVTIDASKNYYKLSEDCRTLSLSSKNSLEANYVIAKLSLDQLILKKKILTHEYYILYFKKIN